jgi:hypothetical protein
MITVMTETPSGMDRNINGIIGIYLSRGIYSYLSFFPINRGEGNPKAWEPFTCTFGYQKLNRNLNELLAQLS